MDKDPRFYTDGQFIDVTKHLTLPKGIDTTQEEIKKMVKKMYEKIRKDLAGEANPKVMEERQRINMIFNIVKDRSVWEDYKREWRIQSNSGFNYSWNSNTTNSGFSHGEGSNQRGGSRFSRVGWGIILAGAAFVGGAIIVDVKEHLENPNKEAMERICAAGTKGHYQHIQGPDTLAGTQNVVVSVQHYRGEEIEEPLTEQAGFYKALSPDCFEGSLPQFLAVYDPMGHDIVVAQTDDQIGYYHFQADTLNTPSTPASYWDTAELPARAEISQKGEELFYCTIKDEDGVQARACQSDIDLLNE